MMAKLKKIVSEVPGSSEVEKRKLETDLPVKMMILDIKSW